MRNETLSEEDEIKALDARIEIERKSRQIATLHKTSTRTLEELETRQRKIVDRAIELVTAAGYEVAPKP